MTPDELRAECEARGIPVRRFDDGRVQCLDPSQLPGVVRAHLRQDGHLRGHADAPPEVAPEPPVAEPVESTPPAEPETEAPAEAPSVEESPAPRRSMRR